MKQKADDAVGVQPLTGKARVQSQANPRNIFVGQSGKVTGPSQSTFGFPCQYHSAKAPTRSNSSTTNATLPHQLTASLNNTPTEHSSFTGSNFHFWINEVLQNQFACQRAVRLHAAYRCRRSCDPTTALQHREITCHKSDFHDSEYWDSGSSRVSRRLVAYLSTGLHNVTSQKIATVGTKFYNTVQKHKVTRTYRTTQKESQYFGR